MFFLHSSNVRAFQAKFEQRVTKLLSSEILRKHVLYMRTSWNSQIQKQEATLKLRKIEWERGIWFES